MLEVVYKAVEVSVLAPRADEDGVQPDDAAAPSDGLDLLVAQVALDIPILAHTRVGDDHRARGLRQDVVKSGRAEMRKVDDNAECFTLADDRAAKGGQAVAG